MEHVVVHTVIVYEVITYALNLKTIKKKKYILLHHERIDQSNDFRRKYWPCRELQIIIKYLYFIMGFFFGERFSRSS